ncbi:MAG: sensor histidine kinase [Armatimonadota bacterium]
MKWRSFGVRLTLWNVAVLALILTGFAGAVYFTVERSLSAAVDQELLNRARGELRRWNAPPPPLGPFARPPVGGPEGPPELPFEPGIAVPPRFPQRGPAPGPGERFQGLPPGPPGGFPGERGRPRAPDREGYLRRPRVLSREGEPLNPDATGPWDPAAFRQSLSGRTVYSVVEDEGEPIRVLSLPARRRGEIVAVVQVGHPLTEQRRLLGGLARALLMLVPIALLLAAGGALFLTGRALGPVREVTQAAAQLGADDLSRRLQVTGDDELSQLASTFNGMLARLEEAFTRLAAAYEQERRFAADASHELRTPLTVIKANTSLMLSGEWSAEDYREALRAADQAADSMGRTVQDLLLLARSDAQQLPLSTRAVSLADVLAEAERTYRGRGARLVVETPAAGPVVLGDFHYLSRLVGNLVENALRHTPETGTIRLSTNSFGDRARVVVADTGEGIPPEHLPHVTERFYRVDTARSRERGGTGLGLAICDTIARAHGGSLRVESHPGEGTTVTVELPQLSDSALPTSPAALPVADSSRV